mgnify:CR=1 FL=1
MGRRAVWWSDRAFKTCTFRLLKVYNECCGIASDGVRVASKSVLVLSLLRKVLRQIASIASPVEGEVPHSHPNEPDGSLHQSNATGEATYRMKTRTLSLKHWA